MGTDLGGLEDGLFEVFDGRDAVEVDGLDALGPGLDLERERHDDQVWGGRSSSTSEVKPSMTVCRSRSFFGCPPTLIRYGGRTGCSGTRSTVPSDTRTEADPHPTGKHQSRLRRPNLQVRAQPVRRAAVSLAASFARSAAFGPSRSDMLPSHLWARLPPSYEHARAVDLGTCASCRLQTHLWARSVERVVGRSASISGRALAGRVIRTSPQYVHASKCGVANGSKRRSGRETRPRSIPGCSTEPVWSHPRSHHTIGH